MHREARREGALQPIQLVPDRLAHRKSIGAVTLIDAHGDRALPLQVQGSAAVVALSKLYAAYISQPYKTSALRSLHDHLFEIANAAQAAL